MDYSEEYEEFINDITCGTSDEYVYLDEMYYEDEYSHNDIHRAQEDFMYDVREYLREYYPNIWCVYSDWAVHVIKADSAKSTRIKEYYLVK